MWSYFICQFLDNTIQLLLLIISGELVLFVEFKKLINTAKTFYSFNTAIIKLISGKFSIFRFCFEGLEIEKWLSTLKCFTSGLNFLSFVAKDWEKTFELSKQNRDLKIVMSLFCSEKLRIKAAMSRSPLDLDLLSKVHLMAAHISDAEWPVLLERIFYLSNYATQQGISGTCTATKQPLI